MSNSKWGRPLWEFLHGTAEKIGKQDNAFVAAEECRTWIQLLRATEWIMPCPKCRAHFHQWCLLHPPEKIDSANLRLASREWLWSLHDTVNRDRGITNGPALEEMEALYADTNIQKTMTNLLDVLTEFTQGGFNPGPIRIWKATANLLVTTLRLRP
jgi:hypothetical protein